MFKVKKKDTRAVSTNCVFMFIDVVLVPFLLILDISLRFLVFLLLTLHR